MTLESIWPSIVIALSTCGAFAAGRLVAWITRRPARAASVARLCVIVVSVAVALFFYFTPSSRYALLLPIAFAAGFLSFRRKRFAPEIFRRGNQ